jgi:hypothetical protein
MITRGIEIYEDYGKLVGRAVGFAIESSKAKWREYSRPNTEFVGGNRPIDENE